MRDFTAKFKINEGLFDKLGLARIQVFSNVLRDKYIISVLPDIKKLLDAKPNDEASWMEPYKNMFRKACLQFGGADKSDINKTCNKAQTLQKLAEHLLDPAKGLMKQDVLGKWASETTKDQNPAEVVWEYKPEDFDRFLSKDGLITKTLLETGITPADLKKTGTYIIEKMMPTLLKFYTAEDLGKCKFLTDGALIDSAKAKELLGSSAGGGINL